MDKQRAFLIHLKIIISKIFQEEISPVYPLCLQYLYQLNNAPLSQTKQLFITFNAELEELYEDKKQHTIGLEEMIIWTEHIVSKQAMTDIVRFRQNKK